MMSDVMLNQVDPSPVFTESQTFDRSSTISLAPANPLDSANTRISLGTSRRGVSSDTEFLSDTVRNFNSCLLFAKVKLERGIKSIPFLAHPGNLRYRFGRRLNLKIPFIVRWRRSCHGYGGHRGGWSNILKIPRKTYLFSFKRLPLVWRLRRKPLNMLPWSSNKSPEEFQFPRKYVKEFAENCTFNCFHTQFSFTILFSFSVDGWIWIFFVKFHQNYA